MSSQNIAIKIENISKLYRIGVKEAMNDSLGKVIIDIIGSPIKNYKKYRSLYKFDDINIDNYIGSTGNDTTDIIWALKNVSFEVRKGEVLGVIGRNGAGKSTLLKILTKITPPTEGRIEVYGRVSSLLEVGTGFHQELTGRENVYLNGTMLGMKKKEVDDKFEEIVAFSGVERFLDTPVKRYSSGMRVRLAFAVAAHLEPEILLVDEVLAVGDAEFQKKCLKKMEDVGQHGRTVLFVSHSMPAITRLCQRVVMLDEGRIVKDGPSHQVVSEYMSVGICASAQRKWRDPKTAPGKDIVRLRGVCVQTENREISGSMDITSPIAIEMEYEVLKSGRIMLPHFHIFNDEGVHVFVTIDQDPTWRRKKRPKGYYRSTAWIPGNLLSEGTMYVTPALLALNPTEDQFYERDIVSFQVVDSAEGNSARGDYSSDLGGVVRPLLIWETEYRKD